MNLLNRMSLEVCHHIRYNPKNDRNMVLDLQIETEFVKCVSGSLTKRSNMFG